MGTYSNDSAEYMIKEKGVQHCYVVKVRSPGIGIIRYEDIAWVDVLSKLFQDRIGLDNQWKNVIGIIFGYPNELTFGI